MTRDELCASIPHAGTMCLLDEVVHWDDARIVCRSATHRLTDNPLRNEEGLPAVCGVEYAAQAMAVHGALRSAGNEPPKVGYIAALRQIRLHAERLDETAEPLTIEAQREGGDEFAFLYAFTVSSDAKLLLEGKALVVHQPREAQ
ncbi:3-hydroxylacyl-ACP dehydratase [Thiohalomonas denitrificans]|uniref:3-hydroxylacyl-ACP dehydratase n=1 Tax=Thiohalomonas denitrificans TaxID=415747 RepID=UPI0026F04823|nr:3-hydroxylacyl-ACP dehydratase [Thiohalomonas denitrificans]